MPEDAARKVDVYWSLQSPYCYFLLDRLLWLERQAGNSVTVRPVMPGVLRVPERYADRTRLEEAYLSLDCERTAAFLGLTYAEPRPSPVVFDPDRVWTAAAEQPRVAPLYDLFVMACRHGRALPFLDRVMRLLWDGSTEGWDEGDHLDRALAAAGLDRATLAAEAAGDPDGIAAELAANAEAMLTAGYHGVPLMVLDQEPFYGQDRFDQLLWRLGLSRT